MPTRFELQVDTAAIPGDTFDITFDGEHARKFSFEDILPQPKEVAVADGRVHYTFNVAPGERQLVVLQGQPETIGWLSGTVSLAGQPPLMEIGFGFLKQKSKVAERWLDDVPLIVVEDGKPLRDRMDRARVDEEDVLEAARSLHGLENLQQIKYAVIERSGSISVIPKSG